MLRKAPLFSDDAVSSEQDSVKETKEDVTTTSATSASPSSANSPTYRRSNNSPRKTKKKKKDNDDNDTFISQKAAGRLQYSPQCNKKARLEQSDATRL